MILGFPPIPVPPNLPGVSVGLKRERRGEIEICEEGCRERGWREEREERERTKERREIGRERGG